MKFRNVSQTICRFTVDAHISKKISWELHMLLSQKMFLTFDGARLIYMSVTCVTTHSLASQPMGQ